MIKSLFYAAGPLIADSLGVIVFAALMAFGVNLIVATIAGATVACALIAWELSRHHKVPTLQWLSLALVLLSAGATLFTQDPRFVMVKPSVIYAVIGIAMLRRGWMNRYVTPEELALVADVMTTFGYIWAGLMFLTGLANLVVALLFTASWPLFIAVFPLASKAALFAIHFASARIIGAARTRQGRLEPGIEA